MSHASKAWDGRFTQATNTSVEKLNASIPFDHLLFNEDILGSAAHSKMLYSIGVLSNTELAEILQGLQLLLRHYKLSAPPIDLSKEDIHMLIESRLRDLIGPLAGKIHTARSRNDQVALDMRLFSRTQIITIYQLLINLQDCLLQIAEDHQKSIMPGYTHLQRAQPVSLAFHLLAYVSMIERDLDRLKDLLKRVNMLPLGAGALAGTTFNINRQLVATLLRFDSIYPNAMDAVSDRDYIVELLHCGSLIMMHLSRLCEELILWSSEEFGFIEFSDAFSTGSSIMPQKKNPDIAELIRGKSGRVYAALLGILTVLKGLPLAYNKDLQEDKEGLFDSLTTLRECLDILPTMLNSMQIKTKHMRAAVSSDFSNATDLADYLVNKGVPFRDCHGIAGRLVRHCLDRNCTLLSLPLAEYRNFCALIEEDIFIALEPETVVNRRNSLGGTGSASVKQQLAAARTQLMTNKRWLAETQSRLEINEDELFSP